MSLPSSTAPIGAAPQGAVAPSGVMTDLGQTGMAPDPGVQAVAGGQDAPASPLAGLPVLPIVGVGAAVGGTGMVLVGKRSASKAVERASTNMFLAQGKGSAAEGAAHLATLNAPKAGKFLRGAGMFAILGGAGLIALNFFQGKGAAAAGGGAAQQTTAQTQQQLTPEEQQMLAMQQEANLQEQAAIEQNRALTFQTMNTIGGGTTPQAPAAGASGAAAPAATAPVGTTAPAANGAQTATTSPTAAGTAQQGQAPVGSTQAAGAVQQPATTSLVGASLNLASGIGASGAGIAAAGNFVIDEELGTFPTVAAASAAVHTALSQLGLGMNDQRFAVIQTGPSSFRAVHANASTEAGKPLTAQQGTVVQWDAMTFSSDAGLQAYSWNQQRGAVSQALSLGEVPFAQLDQQAGQTGGGAVGQQQQPQTQGPLQPPVPGAPVTGGGTVAPVATQVAGAFNPNAIVGQTFASLPALASNGTLVPGGTLQIQGFIPGLTGGFATAQEAQLLAQQVAPGIGSMGPYARVATMQGADGRFYNFIGSIVARPTVDVQGAAPVSVLGA